MHDETRNSPIPQPKQCNSADPMVGTVNDVVIEQKATLYAHDYPHCQRLLRRDRRMSPDSFVAVSDQMVQSIRQG
jgi:hypothetical protein